jgi:hypothetical protein
MDERAFGRAQFNSIFGKGFKNGLQLESRPADHFEQLAGRRLLFKSNPQLCIPRLYLLK